LITDIKSWYQVAGVRYHNKLEAYAAALPNGWWPHWHFYEDEFSQHDWTQEPHESLSELYAARARQLRDQYDKIIVWSSGGADSDNVIRSFYENGLHIDEIWHRHTQPWHNRTDSGTDPANHCNELQLAFKPRLDDYQERYPQFRFTKINVFDVAAAAMPVWEQSPISNPYQTNSYNFLVAVKQRKHLLDTSSTKQDPSVCHIYGIDKPLVRRIGHEWIVCFSDGQVLNHSVGQADDGEYSEELFYWHPSAAKMITKQAFAIKKFFSQNSTLKDLVSTPSYTADRATMELIKSLIYPHWNNSWWQPNKHTNDMYWGEIPWFYKNTDELAVTNNRRLMLAYFDEVRRIYSYLPTDQHNTTMLGPNQLCLPGNYSRFYKFADD
jgi:hypothetical protein